MNYAGVPGLGSKLRMLLARLDGDVTALYKREGYSFRPRFYPVVWFLMQQEQASVSAIARVLRTTQPAATQTLSEMKRIGLVTIATGADRRERVVCLTQEAKRLATALQPTWDAVHLAAEQLDSELSYPLSAIVDEALCALEDRSFEDRILDCRAQQEI